MISNYVTKRKMHTVGIAYFSCIFVFLSGVVGVPIDIFAFCIASFWPIGLFHNDKIDIVEIMECFESSKAFIFTGERMSAGFMTKASHF